MTKPYVFVTMKIPIEALEILEEVAHVHMWNSTDPCPREKLLEEARKADALYTVLVDSIDEEVLHAGENLKIVANLAVGYDNIDLDVARELGILVTNTPEVLSEATADLAFALLMATSRRIVESANFVADGKWRSWSPMLLAGQDIHGATMGIVGMGRIGSSVARRGKGFNMKVLYHNRTRKPNLENELGVHYRDLDDLLIESDFVVVLTPLTLETKGLLGKREFELMKNSAIIINVSRGPVVQEQALYEALREGQIWGAGLDVFEEEPIGADHPLLTLDRVVALPHIGSASIGTRKEMARLAARNIHAHLTGKRPETLVDDSMWGAHR